MWFVYALYSTKSKIIYVGMSENHDTRLNEHNAKKVKSTQWHAPWIRFFTSEPIENTTDARKLENTLSRLMVKKVENFTY